MLSSRIPALKFLATAGALHYGFALYSQSTRQNIITIEDYVNINIKERDTFSMIGVLKPRSVKLTGGLNKKFIMTDNVREIKCSFDGQLEVEFKEGESAIVTGYCPDNNKRDAIVVKDYITKHSMESRDWETKNNVPKNAYGVESFK